jgi:hypothetical protein
MAGLGCWLTWLVKSVPIGTVFRSKGRKCTKLVRFSGFLALLSRFVLVVRSRGYTSSTMDSGGEAGLDSGRQRRNEAETQPENPIREAQFKTLRVVHL